LSFLELLSLLYFIIIMHLLAEYVCTHMFIVVVFNN
jgi:hypothetical protein